MLDYPEAQKVDYDDLDLAPADRLMRPHRNLARYQTKTRTGETLS
jgi:hypothetical protein